MHTLSGVIMWCAAALVCYPYYNFYSVVLPSFKVYFIISTDRDEDNLNLPLIQYLFTEGEHEVTAAHHGNAKSGKNYSRTMPSVLSKLKGASSTMTAKPALSFVATEAGDVIRAASAGSLPHNRQQVKDMRRKGEVKEQDPRYPLMMLCKESKGK